MAASASSATSSLGTGGTAQRLVRKLISMQPFQPTANAKHQLQGVTQPGASRGGNASHVSTHQAVLDTDSNSDDDEFDVPTLHPEVLQHVMSQDPHAPLHIVSVIGPLRTGKSTLLTRLVKLPTQVKKPTAGSRVASPLFSVDHGAATHTRGVDVALKLYAPSDLLALESGGSSSKSILLLDVEGAGSEGVEHDLRLMSCVVPVSSTLIFRSRHTGRDELLNKLELLVKVASSMRRDQLQGAAPFGHLIIALQDADQYDGMQEHILGMEDKAGLRRAGKVRNAIRRSLQKTFASVSVVPMAPLSSDEAQYTQQLRAIGSAVKQHCRSAHVLFGSSGAPVTCGNIVPILRSLTHTAGQLEADISYSDVLAAAQYSLREAQLESFVANLEPVVATAVDAVVAVVKREKLATMPGWMKSLVTLPASNSDAGVASATSFIRGKDPQHLNLCNLLELLLQPDYAQMVAAAVRAVASSDAIHEHAGAVLSLLTASDLHECDLVRLLAVLRDLLRRMLCRLSALETARDLRDAVLRSAVKGIESGLLQRVCDMEEHWHVTATDFRRKQSRAKWEEDAQRRCDAHELYQNLLLSLAGHDQSVLLGKHQSAASALKNTNAAAAASGMQGIWERLSCCSLHRSLLHSAVLFNVDTAVAKTGSRRYHAAKQLYEAQRQQEQERKRREAEQARRREEERQRLQQQREREERQRREDEARRQRDLQRRREEERRQEEQAQAFRRQQEAERRERQRQEEQEAERQQLRRHLEELRWQLVQASQQQHQLVVCNGRLMLLPLGFGGGGYMGSLW